MRIKSIELQNFRNIASLSLQAAPDVNVIHGENAQGKTNLTEAIWMFTGAKSFRGAKDREMIRLERTTAAPTWCFRAHCGRKLPASS